MSLYFSTKYRKQHNCQPRRIESIGFAGLTAAMSVMRDMNEVARAGEFWIVTVRLGDGTHCPAILGAGAGAGVALMVKAGCYDLEPAERLEPSHAA